MSAVVEMLDRVYPQLSWTSDLAPHQIAATRRILEMLRRSKGAILADEPGLGKTRIALAVAWHLRGRMNLEVLCPLTLIPQWRSELAAWSLEAAVSSHDSLLTRPTAAGMAPATLLIVDEAHHFRNDGTQRYAALARLSVSQRLLLLTATPFCNRAEDILQLVRLFAADDALELEGVASIDGAFEAGAAGRCIDELVIRRNDAVLPLHLVKGTIRHRKVEYALECSDEFLRVLASLDSPLFSSPGAMELIRQMLVRRLESSVAAFRDSVRRQLRLHRRAAEASREGLVLRPADFRRLFDDGEAELFQEPLFPSAFLEPGGVVSDERLLMEIARLEDLIELCPTDSKREILQSLLESAAGDPALVFSYSVSTVKDLHRAFRNRFRSGLMTAGDSRVGAAATSREAVIENIAAGRLDVLFSTEIGAEGLNLQQAARVVHYDLPWNPARVDQRNGRIHRVGQVRSEVEAWYLVPRQSVVGPVVRRKRAERRRLLGSPEEDALDALLAGKEGGAASRSAQEVLVCFESDVSRLAIVAASVDFGIAAVRGFVEGCGSADRAEIRECSDRERSYVRSAHESRLALPPLVSRNSSQMRLLERLRRDRLLTPRIAQLLSRRYAAGPEILIGEMSREFLDAPRLSFLVEVLERELAISGRAAPIEKFIGAIEASGACDARAPRLAEKPADRINTVR